MPELAEVAYFRRVWHDAAVGKRVGRVLTHDAARCLRGVDCPLMRRVLKGSSLVGSETSGKQMLFRFRTVGASLAGARSVAWLGIHLGMTGELLVGPIPFGPTRHDHLVIETIRTALIFRDFRKFGRVRFEAGKAEPAWWTKRAPDIFSAKFSEGAVAAFLKRRARAPIKAVLLMQEQFPGVGNWMADEILWRARIHPRQPAGTLSAAEARAIWRETRAVSRLAVAAIVGRGKVVPGGHDNDRIPRSWLFHHRWSAGGRDPMTGTKLERATIGGRTTCWSPTRQKLR